jgi:hypothetical protein
LDRNYIYILKKYRVKSKVGVGWSVKEVSGLVCLNLIKLGGIIRGMVKGKKNLRRLR